MKYAFLIALREYAENACRWGPQRCDMASWAAVAKQAGMKYAVLTTKHHDGFCLWDSQQTDYTTASQAAQRDFVGEYVEAFRDAGLRVGFYYSLCDWRIPAYWEGPENDPKGWETFREYVHAQVRELLADYGPIDIFWFDGAWPRSDEDWDSEELTKTIRSLQPEILINDRAGISGDFGTPEHEIAPQARLWESCQVSTWRLWGHTIGERWRPTDMLLDMLVECAGKGGNLLLNVGPQPDGQLPPDFVERMRQIGEWMAVHGECIYGSEAGDVCEFITYGRQTKKGNNLYLVIRFWDGRPTLTLAGLETPVRRATLLTTGQELDFRQEPDYLTITGLPEKPPTDLFPVIKLECDGPPKARDWAVDRLWGGDPRRMTGWAAARGPSVFADGQPRPET